MKETVRVFKELEKVIIEILLQNKERRLSSGQIKKYVKNYMAESDSIIQKKLERMTEKAWLVSEKLYQTKALYSLNPEIEFAFEGEDVKPKCVQTGNPTTEQAKHSNDLKDAIRTWAYELSVTEPCIEHPFAGGKPSSEVIAACEDHVLFPDLANHLPNLGSAICSDWDIYKEGLKELDELKITLLTSIEEGIRKCFEGLKLYFVYHNEDRRNDCYLIQDMLYYTIIGFETEQDGYYELAQKLDYLREIPIREYRDQAFWSEYLTVPAKDRDLLEKGVTKFIAFFEDAVNPEFCKMGKDIAEKVTSLKPKKYKIVRELDRLLKYTGYPGECEYLRGH